MKATLGAICVGQPRPFNGAELSAFGKYPLPGIATITKFGVEGDMQADTEKHGGPDMAVHQYPLDHYAWWAERLDGHKLLATRPAFGENLVVLGMTEAHVHIGDQFRLGSTLLEVSQPRQPCWKIEHRFQRKAMVKAIIQNHNCGWYYRVVEEGSARAGDVLERTQIGHEDWSVGKLFAKLYDPKHKASLDELRAIAGLDKLCDLWRSKVQEAVDQIEAGNA
jgi:MOSC domain-containing protein YiiM